MDATSGMWKKVETENNKKREERKKRITRRRKTEEDIECDKEGGKKEIEK